MSPSIPIDLLERLWFYTNFDCTLRCSYCVAALAPGEQRGALSLDLFRRLVDQAVDIGFRQVALTGGEPFMPPDIVAMLEYATMRIDTVVLTNGLWVTRKRLANLAAIERSKLTIQVSLDAANPAVHDRLRGRGTWRKVTSGLDLLLEAGYKVAVRATLDEPSEGIMAALVQYLTRLGVPEDYIYGAEIARVGRAIHGLELSREGLYPEPTIVSDGLYWHPLLIERSAAVTPRIDPLQDALGILAELAERTRPGKPQGVR